MIMTGRYTAFKHELDTELNKAADGFVKIGYLLKVARDTDVLEESGYKTVSEFAKSEYGLTADVVSRYMAINDRYAEDGYSDRLADKYHNYGLAKLSEMLTLPGSIADMIEPEMTRSEIQTIKHEYAAEQRISDIEIAIEAAEQEIQREDTYFTQERQQDKSEGILEKIFYDYFHENPDEYENIRLSENESYDELAEILAPSGVKTIITRIPGIGKLMMSIKTADAPVYIANMRTNEKTSHGWDEIKDCLLSICAKPEQDSKAGWERMYNEPFPKAPEPETKSKNDLPSEQVNKQKKQPEKKKEKKLAVVTPKKISQKEKIAPVQEKVHESEALKFENTEKPEKDKKYYPPETFKQRFNEIYNQFGDELRECKRYLRDYNWEAALTLFDNAHRMIKDITAMVIPKED